MKIVDWRLDFLVFMQWFIPSLRIGTANIVVVAGHPKEKLEPHVHRLARYLTRLGARYGVLTNSRELRVYERFPDDTIELFLQCLGEELASRTDDMLVIVGRGVAMEKDTAVPVEERRREEPESSVDEAEESVPQRSEAPGNEKVVEEIPAEIAKLPLASLAITSIPKLWRRCPSPYWRAAILCRRWNASLCCHCR